MKRVQLLLILLAFAVPFAAADTIQLTNTNLSGVTNIGSVTLTAQNGGVEVTLQANNGFSFKLPGGDILFNSSASLSASSISGLTISSCPQNCTQYTSNFSFGGPATRAGRTFTYDLSNLTKGTLPHGYVSANTISFFISNVTLAQLKPYSFGVHFCTASGTNCGPQTGFASNGSTVPEPGTLSLLGTGLAGLAGIFRRRFRS
jgi:PEP-CTERM motif